MNTRIRTIVALASATTAIALASPSAANAAAPSDYGQHVRHCAQTMGFTGEHNPGMHHGNAGWDGMTCQP